MAGVTPVAPRSRTVSMTLVTEGAMEYSARMRASSAVHWGEVGCAVRSAVSASTNSVKAPGRSATTALLSFSSFWRTSWCLVAASRAATGERERKRLSAASAVGRLAPVTVTVPGGVIARSAAWLAGGPPSADSTSSMRGSMLVRGTGTAVTAALRSERLISRSPAGSATASSSRRAIILLCTSVICGVTSMDEGTSGEGVGGMGVGVRADVRGVRFRQRTAWHPV